MNFTVTNSSPIESGVIIVHGDFSEKRGDVVKVFQAAGEEAQRG
jgi:hypothetical protein